MVTDTADSTLPRISFLDGVAPRLVGLLLVLGGWQVASLGFPNSQFPSLPTLWSALVTVLTSTGRYQFVPNVSITLQRILLGFTISMVVGTVVGVLMGTRELLEDYLTTPTMVFLSFPALIWAFLGILWFGITSYLVPVFVIMMIVTPYVIVNVWEGTKDLDADLEEMAAAFDATNRQLWQDLYIPHLRPYLLATTRIAFSLAWKISLVAEIFGTTEGIGHIVNYYYLDFRVDMIIAWSLPIMVLMFGVERLLKRAEVRLFAWRPELETMEATE